MQAAVGIALILGAVVLLAGIVFPPLTFFAGAWLSVLTLGLVLARTSRADEHAGLSPVILLIPLLVIMYLQPVGLQLLVLPRAEDAPREIAPTKEVVAYPAGTLLESLEFDQNGILYLTKTSGLNFLNPESSQARGQIVKRAPDGQETVFAEVPIGEFGIVGVLEIDTDGSLYVTVTSPTKADAHGVWRYTADGQGKLFTALPPEAAPNGLAFGPDGNLYVADSNAGAVWHIDKQTGTATVWLHHHLLSRRALIGLFPGANGVKYQYGALYVAVSDRGHIVRIPVTPDGKPGEPAIYIDGVPTDDFTFDQEGTLYATTHPYNTVVRVRRSGERTIIATAAEGVIGPTDAAFSTLPGEEKVLYVTTDGGLFEQRSQQRPSVMKLDLSGWRIIPDTRGKKPGSGGK
jgi:sugar lactone lactonase YvrE